MEINDNPDSIAGKRGQLYKRGHLLKQWNLRSFELDSNGPISMVLYKEDKLKKRIPLHLATLSPGTSVDLQTKSAKLKLYLFEIQTMNGVTYEFGATSLEERDIWLKTICQSIAECPYTSPRHSFRPISETHSSANHLRPYTPNLTITPPTKRRDPSPPLSWDDSSPSPTKSIVIGRDPIGSMHTFNLRKEKKLSKSSGTSFDAEERLSPPSAPKITSLIRRNSLSTLFRSTSSDAGFTVPRERAHTATIEMEQDVYKYTKWNKMPSEGFRDEQRYITSKDHHFIAQLSDKIKLWQDVDIPTLAHEANQKLKILIRKGIPDNCKGVLWRTVTGALSFTIDKPSFYADTQFNVFGERVPKQILNIPMFGGNLPAEGHHYLTDEGISSARRVLCMLGMEHPEVDYLPMLPDLVYLLLHFMNEGDCYTTIHCMLISKVTEKGRKHEYFPYSTNRKAFMVNFLYTFEDLVQEHIPKLSFYLKTLHVNTKEFTEKWFSRLFVGTFPYQTVLRILDIYLNEGNKILFQVGIAFLKHIQPTLLKCTSAQEVIDTINQTSSNVTDASLFIKYAFEVALTKKKIHKYTLQNKPRLGSLVDFSSSSINVYYRPKITTPSNIIEEEQFEILWSWLPSRLKICDPYLIFDSNRDGFNLNTLVNFARETEPNIMIIKTKNGEIFGAFMSSSLKCNSGFYGDRDTFLWRFTPSPVKYGWSEGCSDLFIFASSKILQVGGGDGMGLSLDNELWHGRSQRCNAFNNDPLTEEEEGEFECVHVEIYTCK